MQAPVTAYEFESHRSHHAGLPERQSGRAVNALRASATGVRVSHPAPSPRSSAEERAFPRRMAASSTLAGETSDREEPAWDGNGFWPRDDVVRLHAPEHRAREANEELHRTFNSDTVGSNPTARTKHVRVVKRSTPQSAKLLCARSNRAADSMPVWLVRTSAAFVKRMKPVRIRPWALIRKVPPVAGQAVLKTAEDAAQTRVGSIPTPSAMLS